MQGYLMVKGPLYKEWIDTEFSKVLREMESNVLLPATAETATQPTITEESSEEESNVQPTDEIFTRPIIPTIIITDESSQ